MRYAFLKMGWENPIYYNVLKKNKTLAVFSDPVSVFPSKSDETVSIRIPWYFNKAIEIGPFNHRS